MRLMDLQNKENRQPMKKRIRGRLLRLASFFMILSGIVTILLSVLLLMFFGTAEMVPRLKEQAGGAECSRSSDKVHMPKQHF